MSDNTNNGFPVPEEPRTREEQYLSAIAGVTEATEIPDKPLTRVEAYLNKIVEDGGDITDKLEAGTNIVIEETSDGKAKISASGEVSSEDTYARAEISAILDGASIDSFADVEAALTDKVDKVSGKGLSANDFTNELKSKLDGIAAGAEVNVQADWNQTTDTADDYIKNKPTLGTAAAAATSDFATAAQGTKADSAIQGVKVGSTTLTPDSGKAVTITKNDITGLGIPAQDTTYVFEGTYNASTNKAATMADIKDGILTGYAQTSGNVAATDKVIEAIGKVEKKADDNKNNISNVQTSLAVGSSDSGKVLTASYSGGTGSYAWVTPSGGGAVSGVKGSEETNYRTGNVSISAANVGAIPTTEKGANNGVAALDSNGKIAAETLKAGALASGMTATTQAISDDSTKLATTAYVHDVVDALPSPMVFKGTLGSTGATISALPIDGSAAVGDTYKVVTDGTYVVEIDGSETYTQDAKRGDIFICRIKETSSNTWIYIPSGDEPSGTVTNVAVANSGGLTVNGSPITSSGTITVGHSNSVTAKTSSSLKKFTYDAYGHVTGSSELSTAESNALASGIDSTKVAQIATNEGNITLLDSKTPKIYKFTNTSSIVSDSMDISTLPPGFFMVSTCNTILTQGETQRYGVSVYMFYKFSNGTIGDWTPIVEVTNAKISSYTLTDSTLTINYDAQGFHATNILSIN